MQLNTYTPLTPNDFAPELESITLKNILNVAYNLGELKKIFGDFIYENEITILAGDTGIGKSLLAYHLSNEIAKGEINILGMTNQHHPKKVLYYDFELSPRSLATRYKDSSLFSDNLYIKFGYDIFAETDLFTAVYIKKDIDIIKPEFIVIDNITALLRPGKDLQTADEILQLLKQLISIKNQYGINILILSHTVKTADKTPLSINQIQGTKNISNLIDSAIMLGRAGDMRYLKHVKCRNGEKFSQVLGLELIISDNLYFNSTQWYDEEKLISDFSGGANETDYYSIAKKIFESDNQLKYSEIVKKLCFNENLKESTAKTRLTSLINMELIKKYDDKYYILKESENENLF